MADCCPSGRAVSGVGLVETGVAGGNISAGTMGWVISTGFGRTSLRAGLMVGSASAKASVLTKVSTDLLSDKSALA